MSSPRQPRPLVSRQGHPLRALLEDASRLEPPAGAAERVLLRLAAAQPRRLLDEATAEDPVAQLLGAVDVPEPLPWQQSRILRGLTTAAPAPSHRRPVGLAIGLAGVAAALLALPPAEAPPPAHLTKHAPPSAAPVEETAPRTQALAGVGALVLSPNAQLTIERDDASGTRLRLASGQVALHAESRKGKAPLVIAAADVEVRIVGTVLAVDASGTVPLVTVAEGVVEVLRGGSTTTVAAGQRWKSDARQPVEPAASDWAAWAMRQVGGSVALQLDDVREVTSAPVPAAQPGAARSLPPRPPPRVFEPQPTLAAAELARRVADARTSFDRDAEARWLRALADAPDASALQTRTALVELAQVLDDDLARPLDAVGIRQELARRFSVVRAEARLQVMLATSELDHPEARAAIDACLDACAETARSFARFLLARALQLDGELSRAVDAMDAARREATELGGAERLAELFFLRARHFLQRGQLERARGAASLARAFDHRGLHTAQLRQLGL